MVKLAPRPFAKAGKMGMTRLWLASAKKMAIQTIEALSRLFFSSPVRSSSILEGLSGGFRSVVDAREEY